MWGRGFLVWVAKYKDSFIFVEMKVKRKGGRISFARESTTAAEGRTVVLRPVLHHAFATAQQPRQNGVVEEERKRRNGNMAEWGKCSASTRLPTPWWGSLANTYI